VTLPPRNLVPDFAAIRFSKSLAAAFPDWAQRRLSNPIFIIGCPRSGTSILHTTVGSHRDIAAYPTEGNELWHPAAHPWYKSGLDFPPMWADPFEFTRVSLGRRTPRQDRLIRATFGAYQWLSGANYFLDKSPLIAFMLAHVLELFPEARFVYIVRDGRAVALSNAKKQQLHLRKTRESANAYREAGYDFPFGILIQKFAAYWSQYVLEVEQQKVKNGLVEGETLLEVQYETFCSRPREEISRIAAFLDLEADAFSTDLSLIHSMNRKMEKEIDAATLTALTEIMKPGLQIKGYMSHERNGKG
jgi:hypothetical protein